MRRTFALGNLPLYQTYFPIVNKLEMRGDSKPLTEGQGAFNASGVLLIWPVSQPYTDH